MPRRKKLKAIDILEGNPSGRLIEDYGIKGLGEPFVPEHLVDDARGCIEVVKQSMPPGIYSRLDTFLLAAFGMAWALHKEAAHRIADPNFEWILTSEKGTQYQNPWIAILNRQALMIATLGGRLGLDPLARQALKLPGARQAPGKFAGLSGQIESSATLSS